MNFFIGLLFLSILFRKNEKNNVPKNTEQKIRYIMEAFNMTLLVRLKKLQRI